MESIKERLESLMKKNSWNVSTLSMELRTPEQTVRNWLRGAIPNGRSVSVMEKLSRLE